jgi:serine/threonine-protein kinase
VTGTSPSLRAPSKVLGRYALFDELASGGMATVHLGRLLGPVGFSRTVAIKRLHPQFSRDPEFVTMFLDEARLAARVRHPNVVGTLDVVAVDGEVFLVMEYVEGESFSYLSSSLRKKGTRVPARMAAHVVSGALLGLHAAHEAKNDRGEPLGLVHRDVSPQNILVGTDGVPRVLDFGVAKAMGRLQTTNEGRVKGKLAYMAPEQLSGKPVTRRADVFAAGIVLWEALAGKRLFEGDDPGELIARVLNAPIPLLSESVPDFPRDLDDVLQRALERDPDQRFATALEMADAIESVMGLVSTREVGGWVVQCAQPRLDVRAQKVADVESSSGVMDGASLPQALASLSSAPPPMEAAPISVDGGTGRSQINSVVDRRSLEPKRGAARWLPFVLGALLVLALPIGFLVQRSMKQPVTEPGANVSAALAPSKELPVVASAPPVTEPEPLASVAPSAAPLAKPKALPKSKPATTGKPKSGQKPGSLYSRD